MSLHIRSAVAALVLAAAAGATPAQPSVAASAPARGAPVYRSAFDGYRPFKDQAVGSWREANDLVGRIGGWQAYAREGQAAPAAAPASSAVGHTGHETP